MEADGFTILDSFLTGQAGRGVRLKSTLVVVLEIIGFTYL